jgi:hypothetical protein
MKRAAPSVLLLRLSVELLLELDVATVADDWSCSHEGITEAQMPEAPATVICNRPQRTVAIA